MQYFRNYHTLEELKKEYKKLALKNHPDINKSPEATKTMQAINSQYAERAAHLIQRGERARAGKAHANGRTVKSDEVDLSEVVENLRDVILNILKISKDLEIEITGLWIWVSGDTRTHKADLKSLGLRWANKKKKWYFAGIPSSGRGRYTMADIRKAYGSETLKQEKKYRQVAVLN